MGLKGFQLQRQCAHMITVKKLELMGMSWSSFAFLASVDESIDRYEGTEIIRRLLYDS